MKTFHFFLIILLPTLSFSQSVNPFNEVSTNNSVLLLSQNSNISERFEPLPNPLPVFRDSRDEVTIDGHPVSPEMQNTIRAVNEQNEQDLVVETRFGFSNSEAIPIKSMFVQIRVAGVEILDFDQVLSISDVNQINEATENILNSPTSRDDLSNICSWLLNTSDAEPQQLALRLMSNQQNERDRVISLYRELLANVSLEAATKLETKKVNIYQTAISNELDIAMLLDSDESSFLTNTRKACDRKF